MKHECKYTGVSTMINSIVLLVQSNVRYLKEVKISLMVGLAESADRHPISMRFGDPSTVHRTDINSRANSNYMTSPELLPTL